MSESLACGMNSGRQTARPSKPPASAGHSEAPDPFSLRVRGFRFYSTESNGSSAFSSFSRFSKSVGRRSTERAARTKAITSGLKSLDDTRRHHVAEG